MPRVVAPPESRAATRASTSTGATNRVPSRCRGDVSPGGGGAAGGSANEPTCGAQAPGAGWRIRRIFALGRRRWRSFRKRANGAERRQHRLLPRALNEATLRPGTVYVDPYGHVLVLAKRVAQS